MSLRDQLVAAGLVSKKKARRAKQEKRKADKQERGKLVRKTVRDAEEAARNAARESQRLQEREAARRAQAEVRNKYERVLRIRQLIRAHEVRAGGPVVFHHRDLSGRRVLRLQVSAGIAGSLRRGRAAIAAENLGNRIRYAVVSQVGAERLRELAPEVLVHWGSEEGSDGIEATAQRDWEPDLRARRATAEDLARFADRSRTTSG